MVQFSNLTIGAAVVNQNEAMEAETISKNGRNLKSHTSRRVLVVLISLIFVFPYYFAYAQETKPSIAVIDLKYDLEDPSKFEWAKDDYTNTGYLIAALIQTNKYTVIERARVRQAIEELGLESTQNANDRASEIGNLLGAQKVITGKVLTSNNGQTMVSTVSVNLVDIETGAIEATATTANEFKKRRLGKNRGKYFESDASRFKSSKILIDDLMN